MGEAETDLDSELTLDGNAVAGMLQELFARDMTAVPAECAHCGGRAEMGRLLAYTHGPGITLRCPFCQGVILRIALTDDWVYFDARGAAFVRFERPPARPT